MATIRFPPARRGSTYDHTLDFSVASGSIANTLITMMVKRHASDTDEEALVHIDNASEGGITVINATNPCRIRIQIPDDIMATLPAADCVAGVQLEMANGETKEIGEDDDSLDPTFTVRGDVVRRYAT